MKKDKKARESVHLECFTGRYRRSNRKNKSKLLTELSDIYGYNRKYFIQFFRGLTGKKYERKGRKHQFDPKALSEPLKKVWLATDQMCSKRLKAAIDLATLAVIIGSMILYNNALTKFTEQKKTTITATS